MILSRFADWIWWVYKSDNLLYNTVGRWVDGTIVPPSDGPMFISINWDSYHYYLLASWNCSIFLFFLQSNKHGDFHWITTISLNPHRPELVLLDHLIFGTKYNMDVLHIMHNPSSIQNIQDTPPKVHNY